MNKVYVATRDQKVLNIYISQSRDMLRASNTANYDEPNATIVLPRGTTFRVIRLADAQIRIELLESPDKYLRRVKFYTTVDNIGNLEIEPYK